MTNLSVHPGDEVLIRGRVKEYISGVGVRVELFSKTDQYEAWIREDLIEQVRPAAETRTHTGFTVAETRQAIREMDQFIAAVEHTPAEPGATAEMVLATLRDARASLIGQLDEVGVTYEPEGDPR